MSSFSGGGDEPSTAELVVVAISVTVTVALFGYVAWHAATTPTHATPEASVAGSHALDDGRLGVTVAVSNPGGTGLESVTVSAGCTDETLTFEHVPAAARLSGTVVCPAGIEDPSVSILSWVESQGSRTN